jgi:outer membrane usher protein
MSKLNQSKLKAIAFKPKAMPQLIYAALLLHFFCGELVAANDLSAPAGVVASETAKISANSADVKFSKSFFGDENGVDYSRFEQGNVINPGLYRVDLAFNDAPFGREDVLFKAGEGDSVQPCFLRERLEVLGVNFIKVDEYLQKEGRVLTPLAAGACAPIEHWIPGASAQFDAAELKLNLSVPQIFLKNRAQGWVDPALWEDGINAAMLDYDVNAFFSKNDNSNNTSLYAGLRPGVNIAGWRLRHSGSFNAQLDSDISPRYNAISTYAEHDVTSLNSQFRIGDSNTQGALFNSFNLRGISLFSNEQMLPDSLRGYAPAIRGVARTNAKVTVVQHGATIMETTVAPGPFELSDLYQTGSSGDFNVSVTEADGSVSTFIVPYSSVPQLVRKGFNRYSLSAGQYQDSALQIKPYIAEATLQHGLTDNITVFGGLQVSGPYQSAILGSAFNTPIGAISAEVNQSHAAFSNDQTRNGQSYRLAMSNTNIDTGTNISLAAYRYSTKDYLALSDAMQMENLAQQNGSINSVARQRKRFEVTLNQTFAPGWGNAYISGYTSQYWNGPAEKTFSVGYNNSWHGINFGLTAQKNLSNTNANGIVKGKDLTAMLNISMPLGKGVNAPMLSMQSTVISPDGSHPGSLGINGSIGEEARLTYNAQLAHQVGNDSINAGLAYRSDYGQMNVNAGVGSNYSQASAGFSGGVVAYAGGVKFGPSIYNGALAIVEADDAVGSRIDGAAEAYVGQDGKALVSNLTEYRSNALTLNPQSLPLDVELGSVSHTVIPRAGSVSLVKYETKVKRTVLLKIIDSQVPFGAQVLDAEQKSLGTIGQQGKAVIAIDGKNQQPVDLPLLVKWGADAAQSCRVQAHIPVYTEASRQQYDVVEASCK